MISLAIAAASAVLLNECSLNNRPYANGTFQQRTNNTQRERETHTQNGNCLTSMRTSSPSIDTFA